MNAILTSIFFIAAATTTMPGDDAINAKNAAIDFFRAIARNDVAYIQSHFCGDPAEAKCVAAMQEFFSDNADFRAICVKRFGPAAAANVISIPTAEEVTHELKSYTVTFTGDIAHLRERDAGIDSVVLRNVAGQWKVQSVTGSPGKTAQALHFLATYAPVLREITRETKAGTYASADEVKQAFAEKWTQARRKAAAAEASPATQPQQ